MKVAVSDKFPGFPESAIAIVCEVYFNGKQLRNCFAADSDRGVVICAKLNRDGSFMIRDGEVVTEMRHGNVCIYVPPEYEHLI